MGKLHVATTYKVKWSTTDAFPHKSYEFRRLLNELGVGVASTSDDYLDFEVLRKQWETAIILLESVKADVDANLITKKTEAVLDILNQLKCSPGQALNVFKAFLAQAEPDDEYLHFSFF